MATSKKYNKARSGSPHFLRKKTRRRSSVVFILGLIFLISLGVYFVYKYKIFNSSYLIENDELLYLKNRDNAAGFSKNKVDALGDKKPFSNVSSEESVMSHYGDKDKYYLDDLINRH